MPLCEALGDDGYTTEEHKLRAETRKILSLPELSVSMTSVRVPVAVGHGVAALVEPERPLSTEEARRLLNEFPGVEVFEAPDVPTPLDVAGRDDVLVGRLRQDFDGRRLWLWSVSDNLRKGAATNAIQIAETLLERRMVRRRDEPARTRTGPAPRQPTAQRGGTGTDIRRDPSGH